MKYCRNVKRKHRNFEEKSVYHIHAPGNNREWGQTIIRDYNFRVPICHKIRGKYCWIHRAPTPLASPVSSEAIEIEYCFLLPHCILPLLDYLCMLWRSSMDSLRNWWTVSAHEIWRKRWWMVFYYYLHSTPQNKEKRGACFRRWSLP